MADRLLQLQREAASRHGTFWSDMRWLVEVGLAAVAMREAFEVCDGTRGRFSCTEQHDNRCPKSRASSPDQWRGEWVCDCGSEALDTALAAFDRSVEGGA